MGAFLNTPMTDKKTDTGEGSGVRYAVSAMQGWRMEMEDAHACNTSMKQDCSYFSVFDGHAGPKVAKFCANNLLGCITDSLDTVDISCVTQESMEKGLKKGFLKLDEMLLSNPTWSDGVDRSGATAIVSLITPNNIIFANCGDSRGILCSNRKVAFATADHKPYNEEEKARIEKAGGTVMMQRINGSLAVSRALGDFDYKKVENVGPCGQLVSPEPEITFIKRNEAEDQFLILACDGIFDVMTNEEVVEFILRRLEFMDDLSKICSDLIDTCLNKVSTEVVKL